MKSRELSPVAEEITERLGVVKFFTVAGSLTAALTLLTWLVLEVAHKAAWFHDYRAIVVLAAFAISLFASSAWFDRLPHSPADHR